MWPCTCRRVTAGVAPVVLCSCGAAIAGAHLGQTCCAVCRYFVVADVFMMMQYIYYGALQRRREKLLQLQARRRHHHRRQPQQPSSSSSRTPPASQQRHTSGDEGKHHAWQHQPQQDRPQWQANARAGQGDLVSRGSCTASTLHLSMWRSDLPGLNSRQMHPRPASHVLHQALLWLPAAVALCSRSLAS